MAIDASKFTIDASGNIRQVSAFVPGTDARFTTLELHAWLQDLADNAAPAGDDLVSILGGNPSELAGKRNASRPMALTLLPNYNINDATSQWFKFGSIEQNSGNDLYTGLKVIGSLVASSPIYIYQNGAKVTKYWADADVDAGFQILMKAKAGGTLIDGGDVTVFSRKYGQTYSHFDVNLAAGGEQAAALATSLDANIALSAASAEAIWNTITVTPGDSNFDMGDGNGSKAYKGVIALNGTTTLAQAYQALMWACSESSTATINSVPGWRYRKLNAAYPENIAAPFGTFAGGKFFVAQGWRLTGVMSADSKNYQLVSHDGTIVIPPTSITIEVTNTTASDYVLVARDDGAGGIDDAEYTVSASAGATSINVTGLKPDTPTSGVIRIDGDRYTYTGWSGTTVSGLSPAIKSGGYSSRPAFIPFIDGVPGGATIQSAAMQFNANFTARFRVRNAGGSPIVPFESTMSVTSNGGSGTAVRNPDA